MRLVICSLLFALVLVGSSTSVAADGVDFLEEAKALLVVGACADGVSPVKPKVTAAHCKQVRAAQAAYRKSWLAPAREFFAAHVPATVPKVVVYPFAGGDLATALAVYPDADEITTLSLEPAGDPRALSRLSESQIKTALTTVAKELSFLYKANFSVTMNMIGAMRAGKLPTQLIFGLSALVIHGYEPVGLRYFELTDEGGLRYLTAGDVVAIDALRSVGDRNRAFSNIELKFKRPGSARVQVYRHIQANLDDAHLDKTPAALRHLERKGKVAAMTKAASYLLTFSGFKSMRKYVIDHVQWMVSDSTGLPPAYGTPAGFEYETYGEFETSNMKAGGGVAPAWKAMFKAQPRRKLKFRFGYPDGKHRGHLIIMRKPAP